MQSDGSRRRARGGLSNRVSHYFVTCKMLCCKNGDVLWKLTIPSMTFCRPVTRFIFPVNYVVQNMLDVVDQFGQFSVVWSQDTEVELKAFLDTDPRLADFEDKFRFYSEFEERFLSEPDCIIIGPIAIQTGRMYTDIVSCLLLSCFDSFSSDACLPLNVHLQNIENIAK